MLHFDLYSSSEPKKRSLPKYFLKLSIELIRYSLFRRHSKKKIHSLSKRVQNLGFRERASVDLWRIVNRTDGYGEGALAAEELLKFCLDHYEPSYAPVIERCLAIAGRGAMSEKRTSVAVMAAEFYCLQQQRELAEKFLLEEKKNKADADLFLAFANLQDEHEDRVDYINKSFELYSLDGMLLSDDEDFPLFDRLEPDHAKLKLVDGPLVSIIIPLFNSEATVWTALRSIQQQSWSNFECIVVDDFSADGSIEVVERFIRNDKRFKLVKMDKNMGAYVARNTALGIASGEFVTCHDSDDWSHPSKIELQIQRLLADNKLMASMSRQARARDDLSFIRRGIFGAYIGDNLSSAMFRRGVFDQLGHWDSVRFGADGEFLRRFYTVFGKDKIGVVPKLLSFQRYTSGSLTGESRFGYNGYFYGARQYYFNRQIGRQKKKENLNYPFPMIERPFAVPRSMSPLQENAVTKRHFDVIIASDFRMAGGSTLSSIEEIQAQHRAGLRTGIVQMYRYDYDAVRALSPKVTALLDEGAAEIIVYGEDVTCDLLLVRYPPVLQSFQAFVPTVKARTVKVLVNQPPMSDYGKKARVRYTIPECVKNVNRYFGKDATWHPIGPAVRDAIAHHHPEWLGATVFSEQDWHNIVDIREWRRSLDHKISERPIIGRHSRDHEMKWPADRKAMLAAYPKNNDFQVRVLGGAKFAKKVLGSLPSNWTVYPFDSVAPAEFLKSIDVFVYFTNEAWVESFGRVVIEAMSVGVPVILPHSYKPLFEDAALYGTPEDVQPLVRKLVSDPVLYRSQVERAFAYVDEKFGYGMHIERVKALLSTRGDLN